MQANKVLIISMLCLCLLGCGGPENNESHEPPVIIKKVPGSPFNHVILTNESANRIGIKIVPLQIIFKPDTPQKVSIPYSAIIYGLHGETWVYIGIKSLVFVRMPVVIDHIEGNFAILASAPVGNYNIVSVGATELYGSEYIGNIQP